jgi:hypothetical protein
MGKERIPPGCTVWIDGKMVENRERLEPMEIDFRE